MCYCKYCAFFTFTKPGSDSDPDSSPIPVLGCYGLLLPANEVWGKVVFSEACVKNSVHRGGLLQGVCSKGGVCSRGGVYSRGGCAQVRYPPLEQTPRTKYTPPEADSGIRSMCGRYASYWNTFLFPLPELYSDSDSDLDYYWLI